MSASQLEAGRLWAGGLATASVAALTAVVGILFSRGIGTKVARIAIRVNAEDGQA